MAKRSQTVRGFLIHARPNGERHWHCTLLTHELGLVFCRWQEEPPESARQFELKLSATTTGYRASGFRYVDAALLNNPEAKYFALYLNELVYRFLPPDIPDAPFFGCYFSSLLQLGAEQPTQPILRYFEIRLLRLLGNEIDFNRDQSNSPIESTKRYRFSAGKGFQLDPKGRFDGGRILAAGQLDVNTAGALAVARECLAEQLEWVANGRTIHSRHWPLIVSKPNASTLDIKKEES